MLSLMRGRQINGHEMELLKGLLLQNLFLQRKAPDDEGMAGLFTKAKPHCVYLLKIFGDRNNYYLLKKILIWTI